ncbi:P-loop containing nucleoside triphosphate hydrolase [Parasponia andersonii]|uniref:P-loop containing nucleoside triphosphate hydrolase n=1 Tax=Parasponia andersonii TaxID=3476 RepID=A0A2P5A9N0_PARAD|nr:P-loop containing nucleoside triphosphate hydrolase [Parasponia andersonii]
MVLRPLKGVSLRKYITLVNQQLTLFSGTIRDNITYGPSDNITESEIFKVAKAANIHDFIMSQNDGYETWCGNRAILRNPTVLLLDEVTSALDSCTEKLVQIALDRVMMGRISIVVAHRLYTIQNLMRL